MDPVWMFTVWSPVIVLVFGFLACLVYQESPYAGLIPTGAAAFLGLLGRFAVSTSQIYGWEIRRLTPFDSTDFPGQTLTPDTARQALDPDGLLLVMDTQMDVMLAQSTLLFFAACGCLIVWFLVRGYQIWDKAPEHRGDLT